MSSSETAVESDLLGGLDIESSDEISVPDKLIDQVIGQEKARDTIKKAAKQRRHLMMIGSPGTGKSMLSKAMTEILPSDSLVDVLVHPNEEDDTNPKIRTVPAGQGEEIVEAHEEEVEKNLTFRRRIMTLFGVIVLGYSIIIAQSLLLGIIATGIIYLVYKLGMSNLTSQTPKLLINRKEDTTAPFKDATGAHSGALLGDVRHDPFQSSDRATPAHNRIESGKIHESNQGVLFIDEINTLDVKDQQKLMTAIQEGEFSITGQSERSSGAMVQTDPVPTDFIMVAAGNMDAIENMHPALRDRIKGYGYEVYMDDKVDDSAEMRQKYAQFVAQEVERDENIPHFTAEATAQIVKEAKRRAGEKGKLTLQLRDLGGIVRTAGDLARADGEEHVSKEHVAQAKEKSKSIEQQVADEHIETKEKYGVQSDQVEKVGYVNGLAVMGDSSGILLPIVSTVTPSQGPGEIIATGNLQEIAQEAVSNVSAVIKKATGKSLDGNDIHIQFVQTYEGVDGDSASVTVATAVLSSLTGVPIRQDVAMTGSLSVQGEVLPVGGVTHKIEAAAKSGMNTVIIPRSNEQDVLIDDEYKDQIEIVFADHIGDVLEVALAEKTSEITAFIEQLRASQQTGLLDFSELNPNSPSSLLAESSD